MTTFRGPVISQSGFYGGETPGNSWFVDTDYGSNRNGQSWAGAFQTMAQAFAVMHSSDKVYFRGNVREQLETPKNIFDISIVGCGNRPRNSDAVTGYMSKTSATWRGPASPAATTPLCKVNNQGWSFRNILFNGPTDAAAVQLDRDGASDPDEEDASHASFYGCRFDGGTIGLECIEVFNVLVDDCHFVRITAGTGYAIKSTAGAGVALPLNWEIRNSRFAQNDNHIVATASGWHIHDNIFDDQNVTSKIDLNGGTATNVITRNHLGGTYSIAGGYRGAGAGDSWYGNWSSTSPTVSDPA